jgi:hypothetical protein
MLSSFYLSYIARFVLFFLHEPSPDQFAMQTDKYVIYTLLIIFHDELTVHPPERFTCGAFIVSLSHALDTHHYTHSWSITLGRVPSSGSRPCVPVAHWTNCLSLSRGEENCVYKRQETSSAEPSTAVATHGDRNSLQNAEKVIDSDSGSGKRTCHKVGRISACAAVRPTGSSKCKGVEDLLIYLFIYWVFNNPVSATYGA